MRSRARALARPGRLARARGELPTLPAGNPDFQVLALVGCLSEPVGVAG